MAVVSQQLLQVEPPQAVHIRALQWRPAQFRDPAVTYQYRARIEPSPTSGGVFPPRILRRDYSPAHTSSGVRSSGSASSLPSSLNSSGFTRFRVHPPPPPPWRTTEATTPKDARGPRFTVTAQSVVMQPRPPQRPRPATGSSKLLGAQPFSYPDPTQMRGEVAFDIRLAELARLESDTIKYEEWKSRSKISSLQTNPSFRPSSSYGRSSRPVTPTAVSQPAHRGSIATAMPQERRPTSATLLNRKTSLPATLYPKTLYTYSDRNFARSASHTEGNGVSLGVAPDQPHSNLAGQCTGRHENDSRSATVEEGSSQCSSRTGDVSIDTGVSSKNSTITIESKDSAIHTAPEIELASAIQSLEMKNPTEQTNTLLDPKPPPKFTTGTLRASGPKSDWQIMATVMENEANESPCKEDDLEVTSITELSSNCKDSTNSDTKPDPTAVRRVARRKGGAKASRSKITKKTSSKLRSHSTPRLDCGDTDIPMQTPSLCSLKATVSKKKHGNSKGKKQSTCIPKRSK